jgi:hypothetical protein
VTWLVQPRLVNDPFSDPALLAPLHLAGPTGFLDQVEHKLRAYNWNLLDAESLDFRLTAAEFDADRIGRVGEFRAREAFQRRELSAPALPPRTPLEEDEFRIESVVLDHGTPCLAFAFQETLRINVWKEGLDRLRLPVGPWLNEAKRAVRHGAPDDSAIHIHNDLSVPLGVLKQHALRTARGHRIAYVAHDCPCQRARLRLRAAEPITTIEARLYTPVRMTVRCGTPAVLAGSISPPAGGGFDRELDSKCNRLPTRCDPRAKPHGNGRQVRNAGAGSRRSPRARTLCAPAGCVDHAGEEMRAFQFS